MQKLVKKRSVILAFEGETSREEFPVARAGLLKSIATASEASGIPCLGLVLFCKEGNNIPDGMTMAQAANALLTIVKGDGDGKEINWKAPSSWKVIM